ncbi:endolytic transglycosylase MltG [Tenacibaculum sp. UWU-22]|uniref:endolytic transglycosylase MltG n=1 Tax=Tenacibaculum sp. UWU-22 TaxID=3234187 RepID=UPI0034DB1C22
MNKKKYKIIAIAVLVIILGITLKYYLKIFGSAVTKNAIVYVRTNGQFTDIKNSISPFVKNPENFTYVANKKKFTKPKAGRYELKKGMSMNQVVNLLRSGNQKPINVTFNNQDTVEKLAGRIAQQIEADSTSLLTAFTDSDFLTKNHLTKKSALQIYIPNQYEFYWNTSATKFRDRMLHEYNNFWNASRLEKAKKLHLTQSEVITLASIVQKETSQKSERPIVAGLYLNRLRKKWPLQADPTIIFALKEKKGHDKIYKRVLTKDLEINSPYNTYKNNGLPPTLIAMPDISSIDAVLNPTKHNYFYMCASVDKIGFHEFSKTLAQHNKNAYKYQLWVNKIGINR